MEIKVYVVCGTFQNLMFKIEPMFPLIVHDILLMSVIVLLVHLLKTNYVQFL